MDGLIQKMTHFTGPYNQNIPSGKQPHFAKWKDPPCCWVNQLFRLGHGFYVASFLYVYRAGYPISDPFHEKTS